MRTAVVNRLLPLSASLLWLAAAFVLGASTLALTLDRLYPPPLEAPPLSAEVLDRNGELLRAYAARDGRWRMAVGLREIDPHFIDMLLAYEDKRFRDHVGIDALAVLRAAGQFLANGRIVSGGSTITMQLARLIEPRDSRSVAAKVKQMFRAWQIERRLSKDEILLLYLTLAPYGGNIEGVRAAALAWFGREPRRLSLGDAALLVALPQSPEARRPDRHPAVARAARDRVLARMVDAGLIDEAEAARAAAVGAMPRGRREMPALAAHAADAARLADPAAASLTLTIDAGIQRRLETVAREAAQIIDGKVSVAMVMADARTGNILAEVGSADFFDAGRKGWIDLTRAVRSPGSTLKPFIYGLAFEEGLIAQRTLIADRPVNFAGYRPRNFDMEYKGDVSVREALQLSLNVPAISLLDTLGPMRLAARFRVAGVTPDLPAGEKPGLAIGLGGVGLTLRDLVQLYTALANGGVVAPLRHSQSAMAPPIRMLDPAANWQIVDILSGVAPPRGAAGLGIAYKTGTSYGYRDAWSIGFDGRHVLGVWVGRPDGGPVPGISGFDTAAPILFDAFSRSGVAVVAHPPPPPGAVRLDRGDLPVTLRRFTAPDSVPSVPGVTETPPEIVFPPDGARIELAAGAEAQLVLKLQGGRAPFRWLANGRPLAGPARRRVVSWRPDGSGSSTLTVVDAAGRAASVDVILE